MPFLIDGNNLMHALHAHDELVGREGLCSLLARDLDEDAVVLVVFDGPAQPGQRSKANELGIEVEFSGRREADEIIIRHIAKSSAPKQLHVVSTDREVRRAAEKRRCKVSTSEEFIALLGRRRRRRDRPSSPSEPPEKRKGLRAEQTEHWLRLFGFEEDTL